MAYPWKDIDAMTCLNKPKSDTYNKASHNYCGRINIWSATPFSMIIIWPINQSNEIQYAN